jgi:hypothetical protein
MLPVFGATRNFKHTFFRSREAVDLRYNQAVFEEEIISVPSM